VDEIDTGPEDQQPKPRRTGGSMWGLLEARPGLRIITNLGHKISRTPIYLFARLGRRDDRLWVFGNHKGYRDSPRYLAEHIVNEQPGLNAWWLARTDEEASAARSAGLSVAMLESAEGSRLQRKAGVGFLCNSFRDLSIARMAGAHVVHLYHGTPLKRISLDVDRTRFTRRSRVLRVLSAVSRWSLARKYALIAMFVAAGELARLRYVTAFGASPKRVRPLGTPRFDVIRGGPAYDRVAGGDLRTRLGYLPDDWIVLWLPTWREYGDAAWLPQIDTDQLDNALAGTNVKLLVKRHPFAEQAVFEQRLPQAGRLKLLREEQVDVNCLLHIADELITDYSSAAFDFAILERPIQFFAPDVEAYGAGRDLYEPYDRLTGGTHHVDWPSLLAAVREDSRREPDSQGQLFAGRTAEYAGNNTAPDVCRRIVETILEDLGRPASASA
jgi:CDP-glycerol glycerophosphotransferase